MNGEVAGDLVGAALIARAAEPDHGETERGETERGEEPDLGHSHESACLNCGTVLAGTHCHGCGQAAHVHKTIGAFFHDLLHGVFHFEGKVWRTLPLLAWQPGKLTREYIDGRRASYVSPIALFLFVVFLTFATFSAAGDPIKFGDGTAAFPGDITGALKNADAQVAAVEQELAAAEAKGERTEGIEGKLAGAIASRNALKELEAGRLPKTVAAADSVSENAAVKRINDQWNQIAANPDLALYKLKSSAYKYTWLLIPLSLPFVWLLFPFSRTFGLYDHTVFVTYSLSFMMLLLTAESLISAWAPAEVATGLSAALALYAAFHLYRQTRGTYGLSRAGALWRTTALALAAMLTLVFWAIVLTGMVING